MESGFLPDSSEVVRDPSCPFEHQNGAGACDPPLEILAGGEIRGTLKGNRGQRRAVTLVAELWENWKITRGISGGGSYVGNRWYKLFS